MGLFRDDCGRAGGVVQLGIDVEVPDDERTLNPAPTKDGTASKRLHATEEVVPARHRLGEMGILSVVGEFVQVLDRPLLGDLGLAEVQDNP